MDRYLETVEAIRKRLWRQASGPKGVWYVGEEISGRFSPKMDHLVCFLPGTLALGTLYGAPSWHLDMAAKLMETCYEMYASTGSGLAPEIAYFATADGAEGDIEIRPADAHNLLRPETVESLWYMHVITGEPQYRAWGRAIFDAFNTWSRVSTGGYTSVADVRATPVRQPAAGARYDKMESFFLAETLKYLFLLFADENPIPLDEWVMNTEAHPMPIPG